MAAKLHSHHPGHFRPYPLARQSRAADGAGRSEPVHPLLEPVACRAGGYHGMAVWPDPGRLDVARWTLVL
eukprot:scaffold8633_cov29-Phaeocystis_antarctica.AAC.1